MNSRRWFLKSSGLTLFSLGAGPRFLYRLAAENLEPAGPARGKVLVSIFLRGAMDGLMAVSPLDGSVLKPYRPRLAMSASLSGGTPLLELDERFGLHPALAPLKPFWDESRLAIVHAVGSPNPTRSHFDAQDYMETGTPWRKGTASGWLNRVAGSIPAATTPFGAVALTPRLPRSLDGEHPALAVEDLSQFKLAVASQEETEIYLERLYEEGAQGPLRHRGRQLFDALKLLPQAEIARYRRLRKPFYPSSKLGQSLLQIAYLIKSGAGLRIAFAESDGWDTHTSQGTDTGIFARQATDLAQSMAAFWKDLEAYQDEVVVLTMTEFGRTVRENGSGGTDHGHGSCLFVLGNSVDGGRIHGEVPELVPEALFQGRDLPVSRDFRAVFAEVAGKLFDISDDRTIFPGWDGPRLPLLW